MKYKENNLWQSTAGNPIETPPLNEDKTVDVVVVGGGFTGVTAALRLAEKGYSVALFEANRIGHGGSGRNVGLVNAGLWTEPERVESLLGVEAGEKLNKLLSRGPELVFSNINKYKIACEATLAGTLHCAHSKDGLLNLKERLRQYRARGADVDLLSRDETEEKTGTSVYYGALLQRGVGTIQPLAYIRGLARAAISAGATIYQDTPVLCLEQHKSFWEVQTVTHKISSNAIILATNAYQQDLITAGDPTYTPVRFFQAATKPLPKEVFERILPERQGCWDTALVMSSFRRDAAGRLILGGLGSLALPSSVIHRKWARRKLQKLFPYLEDVEFDYAWDGRIAYTADHLPKVVEFGTNALSIFGYSGRGISPGTVFGRAAADFVTTGDSSLLPLNPIKSYTERLTRVKQVYYEFGVTAIHSLGGLV